MTAKSLDLELIVFPFKQEGKLATWVIRGRMPAYDHRQGPFKCAPRNREKLGFAIHPAIDLGRKPPDRELTGTNWGW
jgi:hypothetical protein